MQHVQHHIAQVNIARMKAPLDDSIMAGFDWSIFNPCPTSAG
jgi:hypothetical protein